jgi:hypothetical protein
MVPRLGLLDSTLHPADMESATTPTKDTKCCREAIPRHSKKVRSQITAVMELLILPPGSPTRPHPSQIDPFSSGRSDLFRSLFN